MVVIDKSTFLDPRFKTRHLDNKEETIAELTTEAIELEVSQMITSEPIETATNENPPLQKKPKGLGALLNKLLEEEENTSQQALLFLTPREQVDREIKKYLEKPAVNFDSDPLQWWLNQKDELPPL